MFKKFFSPIAKFALRPLTKRMQASSLKYDEALKVYEQGEKKLH